MKNQKHENEASPKPEEGFLGSHSTQSSGEGGSTPPNAAAQSGKKKHFTEHLGDLRATLLWCLLAFGLAAFLAFAFSGFWLGLMLHPLHQALGWLGKETSEFVLRTDGPFSVFAFLMDLMLLGGGILSMPFILFALSRFVAPGLSAKERIWLRPICFMIFALFLAGVAFAFLVVLPSYLAVSLKLGMRFGFEELWTPAHYFGAVLWTSFALGLVFQTPLVLLGLQVLGILSTQQLREHRRWAVFLTACLAALLTPGGDPVTLLVTTIPLYGLYEASILLQSFVGKAMKH